MKTKYTVTGTRPAYVSSTIEVEAESAEEAKAIFYDEAGAGIPEFEGFMPHTEWSVNDVKEAG